MKLVRKSLHKAWVFECLGRTTSSATRTSCTDDSSTFLTLRVTSAWRQTDAQVAELACRLDRGIRRRRTKGSPHIFTHPQRPGHVGVPHPTKDLGVGLLDKLMKQTGLGG